MNGRDAMPGGIVRTAQPDDLPRHPDLAGVGGVDTGQNLDEGTLAGAILPGQNMNLPRRQIEIDARQRHRAGERFADAAHLQERHAAEVRNHGLWGCLDHRRPYCPSGLCATQFARITTQHRRPLALG